MSEWSSCSNGKQTRTIKTPKSMFGECVDKDNLEQPCKEDVGSTGDTPTVVNKIPTTLKEFAQLLSSHCNQCVDYPNNFVCNKSIYDINTKIDGVTMYPENWNKPDNYTWVKQYGNNPTMTVDADKNLPELKPVLTSGTFSLYNRANVFDIDAYNKDKNYRNPSCTNTLPPGI